MVPVLGTTVKSSNNPVFSMGITKGDQGLGLGLIDGLVSFIRYTEIKECKFVLGLV
jgi:hypothetical protein